MRDMMPLVVHIIFEIDLGPVNSDLTTALAATTYNAVEIVPKIFREAATRVT